MHYILYQIIIHTYLSSGDQPSTKLERQSRILKKKSLFIIEISVSKLTDELNKLIEVVNEKISQIINILNESLNSGNFIGKFVNYFGQ